MCSVLGMTALSETICLAIYPHTIRSFSNCAVMNVLCSETLVLSFDSYSYIYIQLCLMVSM